jgi:hypothetical protein
MLLTIRSGLLLGWRGFSRGREPAIVETVAVPLAAPSLFAEPCRTALSYFGPPPGGGTEIDRRLWHVLDEQAPAEIGVHPVSVFGRIACVIYVQTTGELPPAVASGVVELGHALYTALERLVRASER